MLIALLAMELTARSAAPAAPPDCLEIQKILVGALRSHALENRIQPDRAVLLTNLAVYFKDHRLPVCPLGGTYPTVLTVTREPLDVEKTPICSIGTSEQHRQRASERRESVTSQRARWLAVVVAVVILSPLLLAWRRRMARTGEPPSDAGD